MSIQPQDVLNAALTLSDAERAFIASSLLQSLDPSPDPAADEAWAAEVKRRVESIDPGEAELKSWEEVMSVMRERRNG